MRRGELAGLRWTDIDFEASTVAIRLTRTLARRSIVLTTPKNGRPRVINIDQETLAHLDDLRRRVPWARPEHFIVLGPDGEPIHPDRLSQLFRKHVRQLGLKPIRLHDLRHTHASLLLKEGVPVKVVTERLGHADTGFTMHTYQHVLPGMQAAAAERFARYLRVNHGVNRIQPEEAGLNRISDPIRKENPD
jgi:integrase